VDPAPVHRLFCWTDISAVVWLRCLTQRPWGCYWTDKIRGQNPRANYTDRATAAFRRSYCQLLRIVRYRLVSATDPLRP
jgi:hypothetical protein